MTRSNRTRRPDPPGEDEIALHTRSYDVRTYRIDASTIRLRGRVTDTKPPGLYVSDDPDPLDVHDMVVDLVVTFPNLVIEQVDVVFETRPHHTCHEIEPAYEALVGLSIARGFSRRVTELFGGSSGCTHVGALLKAMAPVAVQSMYSMSLADPDAPARWRDAEASDDMQQRAMAFTINSCHVWAEDGPWVAAVRAGEAREAPVWIENRLRALGRLDELDDWLD